MNTEIANALSGYIETLYVMNQRLIKLCGLDIMSQYGWEKDILDVIQDIPRLIPYAYSSKKKRLELVDKNGLLEYKREIPYLLDGFQEVLDDNENFLDIVRRIRNKYEHKIHAIQHKSTASHPLSYFEFQFMIEEYGEVGKVEVKSGDFIKLIMQLNILYAKMIDEIKKYAVENEKDNYPYYYRISRINFIGFNNIYNSELLRNVGGAMYEF